MNINQVNSFRIFAFETKLWSHYTRDLNGQFNYRQQTQDGKVLHNFPIIESTAELCLNNALGLRDLCSVEIERNS
jgi:hypothetical protein